MLRQVVFFERNDNAIENTGKKYNNKGNNRLNPAMQKKLGTGGIRLSDKLRNALSNVALPNNRTQAALHPKTGLVVIDVDPIQVAGILLSAERFVHKIIISGVHKPGRGDIIIDIFKRLDVNTFDPRSTADRFAQALNAVR